jgi:rare lipoprotein A
MIGKIVWFVLVFCCLSKVLSAQVQDSTLTDSAFHVVVSHKTGSASFYALRFNGMRTSNGEKLDNAKYTCAHPSLPFGTFVRVTNLKNGKSVVVRVTDRFKQNGTHLVDITRCAAEDIDMIRAGRARVLVEVLGLETIVVQP